MKKCMVVRYEKFVSTMVCEYEWEEVDESDASRVAIVRLGGNPTGAQAEEMNGSRVVMFSRGSVMVEIWEKPECFDPTAEERVVNGWQYRPKAENRESS